MKRSEVSRGVRSHSAGAFDLQRLGVVSQEQTEGGAVEEQLLGERRSSLEGDVDWLLLVTCDQSDGFSTGQTKRSSHVRLFEIYHW